MLPSRAPKIEIDSPETGPSSDSSPAASSSGKRMVEGEVPVDTYNEDTSHHGEGDIAPRRGTIIGTTMNTANTVIGAGILSLAYTCAQVGWAAALFLFALGALATFWGLHLLSHTAHRRGGDLISFGSLAYEINDWFPLFADAAVWIVCFSVSILYIGLAADFLVPVAQYFASDDATGDEIYLTRTFWLTLPWILFGVPLSIPRKLTILQYTSSLAIFFILFAVIVVVIYFFKPTEELCENFLHGHDALECFGEKCCTDATETVCCIGDTFAFSPRFNDYFINFPSLIVAFCCSPQVLTLYNDLINPTVRRMDIATGSALTLCTTLYVIISFFGYFTYGDQVSSDLLGSYPLTVEVTMVRLGIAFVVTFSYPLLLIPTRDSLVHIITTSYKLIAKKEFAPVTSKKHQILHYSCLVVLLITTYCVGLLGLDMSFLLRLGGALGSANLSFTLPGLYFWVMFPEEGYSKKRLSCIPMIILGLAVSLINIILWMMGE